MQEFTSGYGPKHPLYVEGFILFVPLYYLHPPWDTCVSQCQPPFELLLGGTILKS